VALGDDTGLSVIEDMMSLRSHRLGAAALLARMNIQRGVNALEKELVDETASEENRIRAAVGLGSAGHDAVRERLRELLEDGRYHVGAADALATLGDATAVPALERQLELPSLRVRAALGLRRMDVPVDLIPLEAALDHGSDPARVSAAEAIIILTGPKQLAELD
jgi:HEAT repeat protein